MAQSDKKLLDNLYKKAVGFNAQEEVTEYSNEGEITKKKITSKYIPPDVAALKMYLELMENDCDVYAMTDKELEEKRIKLLEELNENKKHNRTRRKV